MKLSYRLGFTIIETMLFLSISGALIMAVLIGTGAAIGVQRYRDSVTSLQSNLQQQYSNVANVSNSRGTNWSCDASGVAEGGPSPIGQSDCVLLGKYITTDDGRLLSIKNVVGYLSDTTDLGDNDIDALKQLSVHVSDISSEVYETEWGTTIVKAGTNQPLSFSIFIFRSPISGVVRTLIDSSNSIQDTQLAPLLIPNSLKEPLKLCLNSGGLFDGNTLAVNIMANATSSSAVETLGDNSGC
jgi:type II secretory pathway pseudopilin PulG